MFLLVLHYIYCLVPNVCFNAVFEISYPRIVEALFTFIYWNTWNVFLVLSWLLLKLVCWEILSAPSIIIDLLLPIVSRNMFRHFLSTSLFVALLNIIYVSQMVRGHLR